MKKETIKQAKIITLIVLVVSILYGIQWYFIWGTTSGMKSDPRTSITLPVDK